MASSYNLSIVEYSGSNNATYNNASVNGTAELIFSFGSRLERIGVSASAVYFRLTEALFRTLITPQAGRKYSYCSVVLSNSPLDFYFISYIPSNNTYNSHVAYSAENSITLGNAMFHGIAFSNNSTENYTLGTASGAFAITDSISSIDELIAKAAENGIYPYSYTGYPITYHYTNSIVSGPAEAAVGDTVTVSAIPDNNYGITDASSQILVTNNDVAVSYNWNPTTNTITFTMPDPS